MAFEIVLEIHPDPPDAADAENVVAYPEVVVTGIVIAAFETLVLSF